MPHYFSIIIDKSVLQSLTQREAKWLFHHFRVNAPPVFFAEILGDLKKQTKFSTGSAAGDVKMLSSKVDSGSIDLNAESATLVSRELLGAKFPMNGRPVIDHAERVEMPDGTYGAYVDNTPMQRVIERWQSGDFKGMEEALAQVWRDKLGGINLEKIIHSTKRLRDKKKDSPVAISKCVDTILFEPNKNYANLVLWMKVLGIQPSSIEHVIGRWKRESRPPAIQFAPYTAYVARLELFFYMGVAHHVITTRPSNQIDMEYFKYLPFTRVFSSCDRLHRELFSELAFNNQLFMEGVDLKASLREMADFYERMPPETKEQGSFTYADYPPIQMDNIVTKAYDKFLPNWRDGANEPKPPRDPDADAKIMEMLKPKINALRDHLAKKRK